MLYFPVVGLLLGLVLAGINYLLLLLGFLRLSIDTILVILLVILTGGIHLDGLSDTFDAILSRKDRDEMLKIMRDSQAGVMGILSIVSAILLKISLLYSIDARLKIVSLILICTLSRWSLVFSVFLFPYARQEGKAKIFIENINSRIFIFTTLLTLFMAMAVWKIKGLLIFLTIALCAYIFGRFINKKIGGITGDTLGATNELIELIILLSVCVLERSGVWII